MDVDLKTIAVFLPFISAALVGVVYTTNERFLGTVSLPTYLLIYCAAGVVLAFLIHFISPAKLNFSTLLQKPMALCVAASIISSLLAWTLVLIAIPMTSAVYTAAGEISYPVFTALFTYLIFQSRELTWPTAIGGLLIMIGSIVLITGKLKGGG